MYVTKSDIKVSLFKNICIFCKYYIDNKGKLCYIMYK